MIAEKLKKVFVEWIDNGHVCGDFANIKGAYLAFAEWLQKNSEYKIFDPMRQIVHRGPWNEKNPEKYLIELQIPLERHTHIEFEMPR